MTTISKTALYFKQVASVIGDEQAEIELQKVIYSGINFNADCDTDDIWCAFDFQSSPQGFSFWCDIARNYE